MNSVQRFISFLILLYLLILNNANSFTLVSPNPVRYQNKEVVIDFTSDSCSNTGYSNQSLFALIQTTVDEYWNTIPTAEIELKKGSILAISADGATPSQIAASAQSNHILVGCNDDVASFSSGSTLAVGLIISDGAGGAKGAVVINDHPNTLIPSLTDQEIKAVLAHEFGHALGLGHSSDPVALMYYSIGGKIQEQLTEDDYDGLSFLYPSEKKLGGIAGGCGSMTFINESNQSGPSGGIGVVNSMRRLFSVVLGFLFGMAFLGIKKGLFLKNRPVQIRNN